MTACEKACEAPPSVCTGSSANLSSGDCSAWQKFTRDPLYKEWAEEKFGAKVHTDPCNCTAHHAIVNCSKDRITEVSMQGQHLPPDRGVPMALLDLTGMQYLNLNSNSLGGTIPSAMVQLQELVAIEFGANVFTGSIPMELAQLKKLIYLSIDYNDNLGGILPPFNFSQFTLCCALEPRSPGGERFTCPLPPGAALCTGGVFISRFGSCSHRPAPVCK